jgi:hypothetical protein
MSPINSLFFTILKAEATIECWPVDGGGIW